MLMSEWDSLGKQHDRLRPWTQIGVSWATKYYIRMDDTDAYIITMCKFSNGSSIVIMVF
jgi:hypothetical protein